MPRRSILLFAAACVVLATVVAGVTVAVVSSRDAPPAQGEVRSAGLPQVGGPFRLVNQNGEAVDESILKDRWSLVFFGFTYCPDYCPTTLTALAAAEERLGDAADNLQILFVTVDPERDTSQALKTYLRVDGFPRDVVGLTGTPEQIETVAKAYRVVYEKVGEGDGYTMNHSTTVYLMGPDGTFRVPLSHDMGPEATARIIRQVMARG